MRPELSLLRCPQCAKKEQGLLELASDDLLRCTTCGWSYPIYEGLPVLLTETGDYYGFRKQIGK